MQQHQIHFFLQKLLVFVKFLKLSAKCECSVKFKKPTTKKHNFSCFYYKLNTYKEQLNAININLNLKKPWCSGIVAGIRAKGLEFKTLQKHHQYLLGRASGI